MVLPVRNGENKTMKKEQTFESALIRLEEIANLLETEGITLDESLKLYEESVKLTAYCKEKLSQTKQKITMLSLNE